MQVEQFAKVSLSPVRQNMLLFVKQISAYLQGKKSDENFTLNKLVYDVVFNYQECVQGMSEVKDSKAKEMPSHYYKYNLSDVKKVIGNLEQLLAKVSSNEEINVASLVQEIIKDLFDFWVKRNNSKDAFEVLSKDFVPNADFHKISADKDQFVENDKG